MSGEESGLDDNGLLGQVALAEDLEVTGAADVDHGRLLCVLLVLDAGLLAHQGPQLVEVDGGTVLVRGVGVDVEVPHADLSEVSRMVFVEVDAMVMLTTGVTATSGMLPVLANATMAVGDVSPKLPSLLLVGTHAEFPKNEMSILAKTKRLKPEDMKGFLCC